MRTEVRHISDANRLAPRIIPIIIFPKNTPSFFKIHKCVNNTLY